MRDNSPTTGLPNFWGGRFAIASGVLLSVANWLPPYSFGQFGDAGTVGGNAAIPTYTPEVVGGLPPGSAGLEQPVFVNAKNSLDAAVSSQDFSSFLQSERDSQAFDNSVEQLPPAAPEMVYEELHAANRVAVVGSEPILLGNVFDQRVLKQLSPTTPGFDKELRRRLNAIIVRKALYQRFLDQQAAGKSNKDRETARLQITKKTAELFYKEALPDMAKSFGFETVEEFHEGLAKEGRTVQAVQREWAESVISNECKRGSIDTDPSIELPEMREYYEDHLEEFRQMAKARFEILTAEFSQYPSRQAAYDAVAEMGNQVYFGNAFEAVAKESSSGFAASNNGQVDWISRGSLKSKVIDDAAFSLPINKLSDILEDPNGYHIVRVLERHEERIVPFEEVQGEIKTTLSKKKVAEAETEFVNKVLRETPIWTRWPDDFPGAMSIDLLNE